MPKFHVWIKDTVRRDPEATATSRGEAEAMVVEIIRDEAREAGVAPDELQALITVEYDEGEACLIKTLSRPLDDAEARLNAESAAAGAQVAAAERQYWIACERKRAIAAEIATLTAEAALIEEALPALRERADNLKNQAVRGEPRAKRRLGAIREGLDAIRRHVDGEPSMVRLSRRSGELVLGHRTPEAYADYAATL